MVRRAKQLVMDQGIMSSPNPKLGKTLHEVTVEVVKYFCNSDEVSKVMPSKKITYQLKSVVSTYMNRKDCCCAI
jgi:hypothetical protein